MTKKINLTTDSGATVEAQTPVIVSASRATDIPAFYTEWFINRLKVGYALWFNPFNQQPVYVTFKNTRVIVFWSKNPKPLIPYLEVLDDKDIHYYFQFTLNDYEQEGFEPNLPSLADRIEIFKALSAQIGKEKVIWRFDPLIVTPKLSPRDLLTKIWKIGNQLKGYTDQLVFSFVDIKNYRKVQNNIKCFFANKNTEDFELNQAQTLEIVEGLVKIRERWKIDGWDITLATCAEQINLKKYGIEHNRCINGDLMKKIFVNDTDLIHYLSYGKIPDQSTLFVNSKSLLKVVNLKDKGQRKACGCMISKDIGMYNTCPNHCIYCYANTSKDVVQKNLSLFSVANESVIAKNFLQVTKI